ncbi:hypothetical protein SteCoe_4479 [Stentor coeruleus]|uniref:Uncharacterized protein n=1 Tax=Stentor coeruleus TaxID=5963 RepID=A0A1R2CUM5_9CILI|nr:hypothetical protein SteCoe_4479 [Stentor coeruleus]
MINHERSKSQHTRNNSKRKFVKTSHTRKVSENNKLVILDGKNIFKAPKIYENQIFRDIYDNEGNHDRIMDASQLNSPSPKLIFQWNKENCNKVQERYIQTIPFTMIQEIIKFPVVERHNKTKKIFFFN